jgi:RNA 2',3'-cyclic 3'-phosphodiesterase
MTVIRTFIALEIPEATRIKLANLIAQLKKEIPSVVNWVNPQNIHLTLKFLGDTKIELTEQIKSIIQESSNTIPPFELSVSRMGSFPDIRHPRVIWIGLQTTVELIGFQKALDEKISNLGFLKEDRPFKPHLTLGRVSHPLDVLNTAQMGKSITAHQQVDLGLAKFENLRFFRSDLKPGGAIYTSIFNITLK